MAPKKTYSFLIGDAGSRYRDGGHTFTTRYCAEKGLHVVVAIEAKGANMLKRVEGNGKPAEPYDLIFSGTYMGNPDEIAVVKHIRTANPNIPIVFMGTNQGAIRKLGLQEVHYITRNDSTALQTGIEAAIQKYFL